MNAYQTALKHYLARPGVKQDAVADKIGKTQPALSRYASGARFPDAATARRLHDASDGLVPFGLWQSIALDRLGMGA